MNPQRSRQRRCINCGKVKPVEWFRTSRLCEFCFSPESLQRCRVCGEHKPLTEYHTARRRPRGRHSDCKECRSKRSTEMWRDHAKRAAAKKATRKWLKSTQGKFRVFNRNLIREYGIDAEDWARLYNKQDGLCACCSKELAFDRTTHVDHNHYTGAVRGLLCQWCNSIIGFACDDTRALSLALNYLEGA